MTRHMVQSEQVAKSSTAQEPRIAVELSQPDERGQREANVMVIITDVAGFNASIGAEGDTFATGIVNGLCQAAQLGALVNEEQVNFGLSIVRGLHPRDQVEALLGAQMAAIHIATMRTAANLGWAKSHQLADQHERALNRLARTFTAQVEALKRYRSKGEQRVYVERVNVNEGGQAIVGNVSHGGGGDGKTEG
jgi:hypothetical protein